MVSAPEYFNSGKYLRIGVSKLIVPFSTSWKKNEPVIWLAIEFCEKF